VSLDGCGEAVGMEEMEGMERMEEIEEMEDLLYSYPGYNSQFTQ